MSKQDQTYPRTAAHLAREYNFGKTFAEIKGVALDAQTHAYNAENTVREWSQRVESDFSDIYAELNMRVETDENDNLIGKINIGANQLTIDTDNFTLDEDGNVEIEGVIRAKKGGSIGTWDISAKSIYKSTKGLSGEEYIVQITAPESDSDSVFSIARFDKGETDSPFYVRADGFFYAKNAYIEGEINANKGYFEGEVNAKKGYIGEWKIASDGISKSFTDNDDVYQVIISAGLYNNKVADSTSFYVGKNGSAAFCIRPNGELASWGKRDGATCTISMKDGEMFVRGTSTTLSLSGSQYIAEGSNIPYNQTQENSFKMLSLPWLVRFESKDINGNTNEIGSVYSSSNGILSHSYMTVAGTWRITGNLQGSSSGSVISDRNLKNTIVKMSSQSQYDILFDNLTPYTFKYNDGTSGRTHMGFIAQEVKSAADVAGIPLQELAAVCIAKGQNNAEEWSLRYEEFVALNTMQIQKLKARVIELERKLGVTTNE